MNNFAKKFNLKALIILLLSSVLLTWIDQITKIAAVSHLKGQSPYVIVDGVLELHYLENTGTAWGMFGGAINVFLVLTVILMIALIYIVIRMPYTNKYMPLHILAILVASGAAGNFIDRLFLGYVRDFVYFKLINFPIFNVADVYITVAMFALAYCILFKYDENDFDFLRIRKHE